MLKLGAYKDKKIQNAIPIHVRIIIKHNVPEKSFEIAESNWIRQVEEPGLLQILGKPAKADKKFIDYTRLSFDNSAR